MIGAGKRTSKQGSFASAIEAEAITPSDTTEYKFDALYIGVSGDVTIEMLDGTSILFKSVPIGMFPVKGIGVDAIGTTATSIVGLRW